MLHVLCSNDTEVLCQVLLARLESERRAERERGGPLFSRSVGSVVVTPSRATREYLTQAIADRVGVCAGLRFCDVSDLVYHLGGPTFGREIDRPRLELLIWLALGDPEFTGRWPVLRDFLAERDERQRLAFAGEVASAQLRYATHRPDWVLRWLREGAAAAAEASDLPLDHPHYGWQADLWRRLRELDREAGFRLFEGMDWDPRRPGPDRLGEGAPMHIFAPHNFPPMALPLLKERAEKGRGETAVYLYLLNPSGGFWFESLPYDAYDWLKPARRYSYEDFGKNDSDLVVEYLRRNAASTRALIERVWTFSNVSGARISPLAPEPGPGDVSRYPRDLSVSLYDDRPQWLNMEVPAEEDNFFLDPGDNTLLSRLQRTLLTFEPLVEQSCSLEGSVDEREFDEWPDTTWSGDGSLVFCRASDRLREVENLLDWLHHVLYRTKLDPEDVLVVTPQIEKVAPYVEAVFGAQPEDTRIAWTVVGRRSFDTGLAAWCGLLDLLLSRAPASEFLRWLGQPPVSRRWDLSEDDLATLRRWLTAAGYRAGLSAGHLAAQPGGSREPGPDADATLEWALSRLVVGRFCDHALSWSGVAAVDGHPDDFERCSERRDLLDRLVLIAAGMRDLWDSVSAPRQVSEVRSLAAVFGALTETMMRFERDDPAPPIIRGAIATAADILSELPEGSRLSGLIFYDTIRGLLNREVERRRPRGVTIGPMGQNSNLPYRAIAVIGLDRDSGFPRQERPPEFDLMWRDGEPLRPRRGDRDSRRDDRNAFFDYLICARDRLMLSYVAGAGRQESPPSVALADLQAFLTEISGNEELVDELTRVVPADPLDRANFRHGHRLWHCSDRRLAAALAARPAGELTADLVFARDDVRVSPLPERLDDLVRFILHPDERVLSLFGLRDEWEDAAEQADFRPAEAKDKRAGHFARSRFLRRVGDGFGREEIAAAAALDPLNGSEAWRRNAGDSRVDDWWSGWLEMNEASGDGRFPETEIALSEDLRQPALERVILPALDRGIDPDTGRGVGLCLAVSDSDARRARLIQAFFSVLLEPLPMWVVFLDSRILEKSAALGGGKNKKRKVRRPVGKTVKYPAPDGRPESDAGHPWRQLARALLVVWAELGRGALTLPSVPRGFPPPPLGPLWRGHEYLAPRYEAERFFEKLNEFLELPEDPAKSTTKAPDVDPALAAAEALQDVLEWIREIRS